MSRLFIFLYRIVIAPCSTFGVIAVGSLLSPKIREGLKMRRQKRDWPVFQHRPIWIHASSGEFEYAKPFIRDLKQRHPSQPIVVTYFSPTFARAIAKFPGVDFSLPLPLDLPGPTHAFLSRLKPQAGFIARTDLWPELLQQAQTLHIPMILFSATKAKMPNVFGRIYLRWLYGYLRTIFCVDASDAKNIQAIAPNADVRAIGDTRFDQVLERLHNPRPLKDDLRPMREKTLVAGSTWPEDEKVLFEALTDKLKTGQIQLILAPHEPTPDHLKHLIQALDKAGIPHQLYSQAGEFKSDAFKRGVLLIDQIGILAELYTWAALAFVGGSFRKTVHSVMEPLAAGCVTLVGPLHQNNREAILFQSLSSGGLGFVQCVKNAKELRQRVDQAMAAQTTLISDQIRSEVSRRSGATKKLIELFELRERPIIPPATI